MLRLQAKAGALTLRYQATVGLQPDIDDPPTIMESEHSELPSEVNTVAS